MVKRISSLDTNYIIKKNPTNEQIGINFKKINDLKLSQISFWPNTLEKVGSHLMQNLNITDLPKPNKSTSNDSIVLIRTEPLKWWLLNSDPPLLSTDDGTTLDLSHSFTQILIYGRDSKSFLNRFLPLDLRERSFQQSSFASSAIHHVSVKLWLSKDGYNLFIPRGFALSLWELFIETACQFGYEVK